MRKYTQTAFIRTSETFNYLCYSFTYRHLFEFDILSIRKTEYSFYYIFAKSFQKNFNLYIYLKYIFIKILQLGIQFIQNGKPIRLAFSPKMYFSIQINMVTGIRENFNGEVYCKNASWKTNIQWSDHN